MGGWKEKLAQKKCAHPKLKVTWYLTYRKTARNLGKAGKSLYP